MPSELPQWHRGDDEAYDMVDRVTRRVGRGMAIGIPAFLIILLALAKAGLGVGVALLGATILSVVVTETLERAVMTTPARRRLIPLFGVGLLLVYCVVIPVWLFVEAGA